MVYAEIYFAVVNSLESAGFKVSYFAKVKDIPPQNNAVILIIGSPTFYHDIVGNLISLHNNVQRPAVILWHLEHLPDLETRDVVINLMLIKNRLEAIRADGRLRNSRAVNLHMIEKMVNHNIVDKIFVFTRRKADFLRKRNIRADFLPLGYHEVWRSRVDNCVQDIDALFIGWMNRRRRQIIHRLQTDLAPYGFKIALTEDFGVDGLWGDSRNDLIRRSKLFINVSSHSNDWSYNRFCLAMLNKSLVISEHIADPLPLMPGEHFVEADISNMARSIVRYVSDVDRRDAITESAYALVTTRFTVGQAVERIASTARDILSSR